MRKFLPKAEAELKFKSLPDDEMTFTVLFSLLQAEEFQGVVQVMREFLPQAEAELKFKSLPDDEMAIIQLIEKHEVKFQHPKYPCF